jgi:hypothetical protein
MISQTADRGARPTVFDTGRENVCALLYAIIFALRSASAHSAPKSKPRNGAREFFAGV